MSYDAGMWAFGVALLMAWSNLIACYAGQDALMKGKGIEGLIGHRPVGGWFARLWKIGILTVLNVIAIVGFCLDFYPLAMAVAIIALTFIGREMVIRAWPGDIVVDLGYYTPAVNVLCGWAVAYAVTFGEPDADRWAAGWDAAAGVLGAIFTMSAYTKLRVAGLGWFGQGNLPLLVAERIHAPPRWFQGVRRAACRHPRALQVAATVSLVGEALGVLFIVPELRPAMSAAVFGLFFGIWVMLGYDELEFGAVLIALPLLSTT